MLHLHTGDWGMGVGLHESVHALCQYEGIQLSKVISLMRSGDVKLPDKKHYVTLEWPLTCILFLHEIMLIVRLTPMKWIKDKKQHSISSFPRAWSTQQQYLMAILMGNVQCQCCSENSENYCLI